MLMMIMGECVWDLTPHADFDSLCLTLQTGAAYECSCHHPCLVFTPRYLHTYFAHLHRSHRLIYFCVLALAFSTAFSGCDQKIYIFRYFFRKKCAISYSHNVKRALAITLVLLHAGTVMPGVITQTFRI